jgi:hypothetical protein
MGYVILGSDAVSMIDHCVIRANVAQLDYSATKPAAR